jgi:hypothetical protein
VNSIAANAIPAVMSDLGHLVRNKTVDLSKLCKDKDAEDDGFLFSHINDFTSEQVKAEAKAFEDSEKTNLPVTRVCPALHGGPLDYPKVATTACAMVTREFIDTVAQVYKS